MRPLSARLEAILQLLHPCRLLADVGTDHGYIPVAAVERGLAQRAVAADLRPAPLLGARRHIESSGVGDRVALIQGNGLLPLQQIAVDAVVMAGMSGRLMTRLCTAAPQVLCRVQQLILAANQDQPLVRAWARHSGWHLRDERLVKEGGRFFPICALTRESGADPAYDLAGFTAEDLGILGPQLLRRKDPVVRDFCQAQRARLRDLAAAGVGGLTADLHRLEAAIEYLD